MADSSNLLGTPANYASPKQLEAIREYSNALLTGKGQQPVHSVTQGLSNIVSALVGGKSLYDSGQSEIASKRFEADNSLPAITGQPLPGPMIGAPAGVRAPSMKRAFAPEAADAPVLNAVAADPKDPDAPQVISKGTGSMYEGLPGWAPGERPMYDAYNMDGKPSASGSIPEIVKALQGNGAGQANASTLPTGNYLPPGVVPSRPHYTRDQALNVLGGFYLPQSERDAVREGYMGQGQPIAVDAAGGKILVGRNGEQVWNPSGGTSNIKAGDVDISNIPTRQGPPGTNSFEFSTPKGPLPVGPQSSLEPNPLEAFAQAAPNKGGKPAVRPLPSIIPPFVGDLQKWSQDNAIEKKRRESEIDVEKNRQEKVHDATITAGQKQYESLNEVGTKAQTDIRTLEAAAEAMKDPRFTSGFAANPILAVRGLVAQLGLDPTSAAPMEVFRKLTASANLDSLKTLLGGLGQVRVAEINLINQSQANLDNSPAANRVVMEISKHANRRAVERADFADEYVKEHGYLDAGFNGAVRKHFADKPFIPDETVKELQNMLKSDPKVKKVAPPKSGMLGAKPPAAAGSPPPPPGYEP